MKNIYIHPTADVSPKAKIGEGTKIWHQAQVREGARIGKNCIIGKGVYIDHDVEIGNNVKIQNYACIYHLTIIEDGVFIGPHAVLTNDRYPRAVDEKGRLLKEGEWESGKITVKKGASIGAGAVILTDVMISEKALVGAGSVVTKDVAKGVVVAGAPAKEKSKSMEVKKREI